MSRHEIRVQRAQLPTYIDRNRKVRSVIDVTNCVHDRKAEGKWTFMHFSIRRSDACLFKITSILPQREWNFMRRKRWSSALLFLKAKSAPLYRHWDSVEAVRPIGGSRGIALLFLDHGTRRGWGVSVTPRPLFTPGKDPVPIVHEAGWAPGPVWTGAENLAPTGIRSPDRPACKPVAMPTTLPGPPFSFLT